MTPFMVCCGGYDRCRSHRADDCKSHQGTLILDEQQQLAGIITRGDIVRALRDPAKGSATVTEAGSTELTVTYPDEPVQAALRKMLQQNIGRLPVVDRNAPTQLLGYHGRTAILSAAPACTTRNTSGKKAKNLCGRYSAAGLNGIGIR